MSAQLPTPPGAYSTRDQAETRRTVELELRRTEEQVGTLQRAATQVNAVRATGNVTIPAPTSPRDKFLYGLAVLNTTGGAITVTLDAIFLGTFTPPAAGKWRTQLYTYDAIADKWLPLGAQSPDF